MLQNNHKNKNQKLFHVINKTLETFSKPALWVNFSMQISILNNIINILK